MTDLSTVPHHPAIEQIVDILAAKTQNSDRGFFRVEVAYFLAKMAASMRATVRTKDRGDIPVNVYALALATSGFGKGHSVNIMETDFLSGFRRRFLEETFPVIADQSLWQLSIERSAMSGKTEEEEKEKLEKEFRQAGALAFTFDSGTPAAVKQMRQKLLLAKAGAINLQIDEIGSNLIGSTDVLNVFLELYDQGMVKQKLTKNTAENVRGEELEGKTPTNALLFGTPSKLLDGGQTEDHFYTFLEIGYARRCIFGWGEHHRASAELTPAEIYQRLIQPQNSSVSSKWSNHFTMLADPAKFGWTMTVEDDVGIALLTYKIECERQADQMAEHEDIRKAEMSHRYFKALKLAGALAFVDESSEVTLDHLYSAMKLVEESGAAFQKIMTREKSYVKLAKYIAAENKELTHADLHEKLPFYKTSQSARNEMMTLATAWGYKQHIIIRKRFEDGIELFSGETLKETNLDKMILSYSDHFAFNYQNETAPFDKLHLLTQAPDMHWCNHRFERGHRAKENVITGFNIIVIDVDGASPLSTAHELLKEHKFMTYTTKRHTPEVNRFRMILPINYELHLDADDYKEFMGNVMDWLPFETDESADQQSKKWQSFEGGSYHYNHDGELLDALKFIPKTQKNEQYRQSLQSLESLDNLERWFAQRMTPGNRNGNMIKYALALVDAGMGFNQIEEAVLAFNTRLANPLAVDEIRSTILVTVAKKIHTFP
jgi:hypothetical protein